MAQPNPDDGPPMSINEMWAVLTNREKNLVGRSLISTHNFDIENFFPSAVRLIYDSNQSRDSVQLVERDTQETKAPHATPDTTQHENITAKNAKLQVEPSHTEGTSGTALSRSEDHVVEDTKLPSDLAPLAATSKTADAPDALRRGSGEAGSHKPMTRAALVSDLKPKTSVQSSASNGVKTRNVFGSNLVSETSPAPKPAPLSLSNDSGVFGSRAPPKPLPEKDNVNSMFSFNANLASTPPAPPPEIIKKDAGFSFGNTPVSSSNASEATATNGLFGSNSTKMVPPATTTSSLSTDLFGASSPKPHTNPAGSAAPTSIEAFGPVATSGGFGFGESNKNPFGGGTSSKATGFGSGLSGPAKPAGSGFFGATSPSASGSLSSQDSAAPSTSQALPESSSQGGFGFSESKKNPFGGGTSSKSTGFGSGLSGPAKPAGSGFFGATSPSASRSLFGQGSAAYSDSHAPTESASQSFFSFSKPLSDEAGADRSTKRVQAGGLFGNSSSNVASNSHETSLGCSAVSTTLFPAHDNPFNRRCSDGVPDVNVFGAQKRKNDDVEGYTETAKKIRTAGSPLPHNGGSMFGGGFGFGRNTSEAKQGGMSAQVSAPTGQASTEALSSTDTTCQQTTGPPSRSSHDPVASNSPIATTSQTQVNTTPVSLFSKEAAGRIEPFSDNDPFIRPSSSKTVAGNVQRGSEEHSTSTEALSSTSSRLGGVTTEIKGDTATTTEDPFRNIQPTVLFDTVKPTVGLPADPMEMPPDSTQDHFVPYREGELNGAVNAFQSIYFVGDFKRFSSEELRLADYNRGQRFGRFPDLQKKPEQAPRDQPAEKALSEASKPSVPQSAPAGPSTTASGTHSGVRSQSPQQPPAPARNPARLKCIDCGVLYTHEENSSDAKNCLRHSWFSGHRINQQGVTVWSCCGRRLNWPGCKRSVHHTQRR